MAAWKYLKGEAKDFKGAPDWAMNLYVVNKPNSLLKAWSNNSQYQYVNGFSGTELHAEVFNGVFPKGCVYPVELIAQRERVTSVNDDRLVQALIAERGSRYGKFADGAEIIRDLKHVMHEVDGWNNLTASQKEALDMIQHKIGRILNGDPNYDDNWKDIAGYATLIVEELNGVKK